jgi:hypothetical protein
VNWAQRVRELVRSDGFALTHQWNLGLDGTRIVNAFSPALEPDPRGPGKHHARDVITWYGPALAEAASIAFTTTAGEVVDDFSRFSLLDEPDAAFGLLSLVPDRNVKGTMSADYFRYQPGVAVDQHRDGFGEYVIIWCLARHGDGGESLLLRDGKTVLARALAAGEILVFRDDLFKHGMTALTGTGARRDALIAITMKDSQS